MSLFKSTIVEMFLTAILTTVVFVNGHIDVVKNMTMGGFWLGPIVNGFVLSTLIYIASSIFKINNAISAGHMSPFFTFVSMIINKVAPVGNIQGFNILGVNPKQGGMLLVGQVLGTFIAGLFVTMLHTK